MKKRVLVIDNEPSWRKFCANLGYTIVKKITPEDLMKTQFDLYIISDRMPLELMAALQDKKFFIATNRLIIENAIEAFRLGAIDYLVKDLRPEVISKIVEES